MAHPNATPWDAAILAKLGTAPYNTYAQDGSQDATMAAMMNAETVPQAGHVDVKVSTVASYLGLSGKLALLEEFANSSTIAGAGSQQIANALIAAKEFVRQLSSNYNGVFPMSDAQTYTGVTALLGYLVTNGNLASSDQTAILALSNPVPVPWWQSIGANVPLSAPDLSRARQN